MSIGFHGDDDILEDSGYFLNDELFFIRDRQLFARYKTGEFHNDYYRDKMLKRLKISSETLDFADSWEDAQRLEEFRRIVLQKAVGKYPKIIFALKTARKDAEE